ncbi:MAG: respiratory nitrate reductase subunit gamma [Candidatus Zixiibacteriota bacterium]|nr:MAG: respiratory nitrate reductase subunit gamma [candidate division Zixibacteria bacterium]
MGGLQLLLYLAILFFIVAIAIKTVKIARMPIHLRWDLYPVPHEKGKGAYGGSYFEEVDWWTRPKNFSLISEIKEMGKEILFIQSLYHHNRTLWLFSFPFHFGMYCLIAHGALLLLGSILIVNGVEISWLSRGFLPAAVFHLTLISGKAGWILSVFGAFGLLMSRLFNGKLRNSAVVSDYFNLIILLALFVVGVVSSFTVDTSYSIQRAFLADFIIFKSASALPGILTAQLWILTILLFYFPFTHMTHFVGKYFTYHKIRWEDEPNIGGSKIEKAVSEALGYRINWSASHIKSGATWAEAATGEASENEKK